MQAFSSRLRRSICCLCMSSLLSGWTFFEPAKPPAKSDQNEVVAAESYPTLQMITEFLPANIATRVTREMSREIQCLAMNSYYEALGQGVDGMFAVAQVVINRTNAEGFPSTVCGVVHQKVNSRCQFSWVCDRRKSAPDKNSQEWEDAMSVATTMVVDKPVVKGLESALFFHATSVRPNWNGLVRVKRVGDHIFYRKPKHAI